MLVVFLLSVSLFLMLVAILAFRRLPPTRARDLVFGGLLTALILLYALYGGADHFTGGGINEAVWFHLRFGLRGAGFAAYGSLITVATVGLVAGLGLCHALSFAKRATRRVGTGRAAIPFALLILAGALHPAVHDLVRLRRPVESAATDFFDYYRTPQIRATADRPKNLVFIFAEGFERTYFDERRFPGLITRLRQLERQSTHFTDLRQVTATGFTMGGMVAGLCGIPLFTPTSGNAMGGMDLFLPGARGLGNLLHESGYFLSYYGGAPLSFAGKGKFFRTQQFDEVVGMKELLSRQSDPAYRSDWGVFDDALFASAYQRFTELGAADRPFALFLLTLDTHHPDGHISKAAEGIVYGEGSNPMLNAVAAADVLIADFIERIRRTPQGANTVVVLASDHLAMGNSATPLLNQSPRRNLLMILEPGQMQGMAVDKPGSTLDTAATVLPFLGFEGEIGLGRDLLDPATSVDELKYIQRAENLRRWRDDISAFWAFPRLRGPIHIDPEAKVLELAGREFSIPVFVEVRADRELRLHFAPDPNAPFVHQVRNIPVHSNFLLIDRMEHLARLYPSARETGWCVFAAAGDSMFKIVTVPKEVSLSVDEIDMLLTDDPTPLDYTRKDMLYVLRGWN